MHDTMEEMGYTDENADIKEERLNDAIKTVHNCLCMPDRNRHSEYIEAARLAYWLLNLTAQGDDVPEYFDEEKLSGIALGQVIMEHTNPEGNVNKRVWFDAAEHIGPDYAQGMYQAAVFVTKVA